ncbi:MAG: SWIM zinc finger family protein [Bacteroidota bacterium]
MIRRVLCSCRTFEKRIQCRHYNG